MAERLKAIIGLDYPEPGKSLELVRRAGGRKKLSPEDRAKVRIREVAPGDWCDDLPVESRAHLIAKGSVVVVQIEEPVATVKKRWPKKGDQ